MLQFDRTVISQYQNSPTLFQLIANMNEYLDPRANMQAFYDYVWNVDTAQGFGLDIWGKIVGVSRRLTIPSNSVTLGFANSNVPPDWAPFNQGVWYTGPTAGQGYDLTDDAFRTLILVKALANIVSTTASSLNQLLRNLFPPTEEDPDRGRVWVIDNLNMTMTFYFEFNISQSDYAILTQTGVLPHPAGVLYNVVVAPPGTFGFAEQGLSSEPFDHGVFYEPPS